MQDSLQGRFSTVPHSVARQGHQDSQGVEINRWYWVPGTPGSHEGSLFHCQYAYSSSGTRRIVRVVVALAT